jgi:tRNA modification GTPase
MPFSTSDTIVAIATPPGRGGIGIVRLSGRDALAIAQRLTTHEGALEPRRATLTKARALATVRQTESAKGTAVRRIEGRRRKADTTYDWATGDTAIHDTTTGDLATGDTATGDTVTGETATGNAAYNTARGATAWKTVVMPGLPSPLGESSTMATDAIDQVVATYFPAPASYTGDDVVELSAHGSPVVLRAIVSAAIARGARLAEPGEFTLRAFLNGRIDLMQAEAVADLIDAATPLQARAAFDQLDGTLTRAIAAIDAALFDLIARLEASVDFPEEGYHFVEPDALAAAIDALIARVDALLADARRGRLIREGLQIAIVGEPNVGKSSVFNALVGSARAIVTDVPGTTRDLVTEVIDLDGLRVTLVDTAGLRVTHDPVEIEGVTRSRQSASVADLVLLVVDRSRASVQNTDYKGLVVANKSDLPAAWDDDRWIPVSATTGAGLADLRKKIVAALDVDLQRDPPAITNVRHVALAERAREALTRGRAAALADDGSMSEEFVLADLSDARTALEEISGRRTTEDLLTHIFSRFCIGK